MPRAPLHPVHFGKLPARGDFVRHNGSRPSVRALDDWIQRGLRAAKTNPDFESTFDAAPPCCFFFSPNEVPGALIGVMRPSRDRSGRRYPFLIALDAGGRTLRARHAAYVPVQLRAFFDQALTLTQQATEDQLQPQHIAESLDPVTLPARTDTAAMRGYKRYLRRTQLEAFWKQLWNGRADERKQQLVGNLVEVLHPLQEHVPTRFRLGLQFPLPPAEMSTEANAETDAYAASFWWEACFRLLRFPNVAPTCFWTSAAAPSDASRSLLLFLRPPPAGTFEHLFRAEQESDHVYALARHGAERAAQAVQDPPPRYNKLLDGKQLTLWNLLQQLE